MALLEIALALPDLQVARAHPCAAVTDPATGTKCAATPTHEMLKACKCTDDHVGKVWLCGVHEKMVTSLSSTCRACAELARGLAHSCPVYAVRVAA